MKMQEEMVVAAICHLGPEPDVRVDLGPEPPLEVVGFPDPPSGVERFRTFCSASYW